MNISLFKNPCIEKALKRRFGGKLYNNRIISNITSLEKLNLSALGDLIGISKIFRKSFDRNYKIPEIKNSRSPWKK